jgi:DNA topoisomerase-3
LVQQLNPDEIDTKYSKWNAEDLPIVPEIWKMKPNAKTKKQLNIIKGLLQKGFSHINNFIPITYSSHCFPIHSNHL